MKWGNEYKAPDGPPVLVVHTDWDHETEAVPVCSHCGGELHARNIRAEPGPGASAKQRAIAKQRAAA